MRGGDAGALEVEAQLSLVDSCLLAGPRLALARYACIDLICRRALIMGCRHEGPSALRILRQVDSDRAG
jgi:hypothetical protein